MDSKKKEIRIMILNLLLSKEFTMSLRNLSKRLMMASVMVLTGSLVTASASMIDFESIPGGVPTDGLSISNQFLEKTGVSFRLAKGTSPVLITSGAAGSAAFVGHGGAPDTLAPGQPDIGNFFLHDDNSTDTLPSDLIIEFRDPVAYFSGMILDVDDRGGPGTAYEEFRIIARNAAGLSLEQIVISAKDVIVDSDAKAEFFAFNYDESLIHDVVISYTGTVSYPGFGFDNFYVGIQPIPEPGSICLLALTAGSSLWYRRKRR
jgi:hypothetical protein